MDGVLPTGPLNRGQEPKPTVKEAKPIDFLQDVMVYMHLQGEHVPDLSDRHVTLVVAKKAELRLLKEFTAFLKKHLPEGYAEQKNQLAGFDPSNTIMRCSDLTQLKKSLFDIEDQLVSILKNINFYELDMFHQTKSLRPAIISEVFNLAYVNKLNETSAKFDASGKIRRVIDFLLNNGESTRLTELTAKLTPTLKDYLQSKIDSQNRKNIPTTEIIDELIETEDLVKILSYAKELQAPDRDYLFDTLNKHLWRNFSEISPILTFIDALPETEQRPFLGFIAYDAAHKGDYDLALKILPNIKNTGKNKQKLASIVYWIAENGKETQAVEAVKKMTDPELQQAAYESICKALIDENRLEKAEEYLALCHPVDRESLLKKIGQGYLFEKNDIQKALKFANEVTGSHQDTLFRQISKAMAENKDFENALILAHRIQDTVVLLKNGALADIVKLLSKAGEYDRAIEIAGSIQDGQVTLIKLGGYFFNEGDYQRAKQVAGLLPDIHRQELEGKINEKLRIEKLG